MKTSEFNKLANKMLQVTRDTLLAKGAAYNTKDERFVSFLEAAKERNCTPVGALDGMWVKHRVSIRMEMQKMDADPSYYPSAKWIQDKLGDNINYTLLLMGLIMDRRRQLDESEDV